ncbi:unnamed protein product [Cuscuta campestris]|uniref:Uncharacterized protein n=1 Tax=Cuscuta campestris TaxID=132261 RepID=A0A484L0E1_9ASTE|nr:unnamed protein product [Cuscuta campestris]
MSGIWYRPTTMSLEFLKIENGFGYGPAFIWSRDLLLGLAIRCRRGYLAVHGDGQPTPTGAHQQGYKPFNVIYTSYKI